MPLLDLFEGGAASGLTECDVCIVGSGPAGCTLAREMAGTGVRLTLLESGSLARRTDVDALNEVENVGYPRTIDQWFVRNRIVGGSSHTWGGRCAPFDAIDFEERAWIPDSGWPFALEDLTEYLERSAAPLGLSVGHGFSDERFWTLAARKAAMTAPDPRLLLPFFWQYSRDGAETYPYEYTRFGRGLADRLGPGVTVVSGATVLRVDPVRSGRAVGSIVFADPSGAQHTLQASTIVLCCGGIENARILLSSDTVCPNGLGNDRDLVGRYLMDHLRGPIGAFDLSGARALQKRFGRYNLRGRLFRAGLRLGPDIQRTEGLLNCAAWLGEEVAHDDPWNAVRRLRGGGSVWQAGTRSDLRAVAANAGLVLHGLKDYFVDRNGVPRKFQALTLDAMCEQRPDRDSRVSLSARRDRFGMRLSRIDWRVHPEEVRTLRRTAELIADQAGRMGLPTPELADWIRTGSDIPATFTDVAHPTGTTRMADDPARGVVDATCQVHGVEGLYVAGSSVFPTAGHCNPTQMIVTLALRLADHLKLRVAERAAGRIDITAGRGTNRREDVMSTRAPAKQRILVTGATGRIGRVVVADLIARGYCVRATTSKAAPTDDGPGGSIEWRRFDLQDASDYDGLVAGCHAVLHLAAEMGEPTRMWRANVEATGLLAAAAERSGVETFCYTSSIAVYGSGLVRTMTEDAPVLTIDHDVPAEYWAIDQTRAYGRTKLGGERELQRAAGTVRYMVLRPAVVVSVAQLIEIREWSWVKRTLTAHRHAHHIYVGDVSDAIIWSMERAVGALAPGEVAVYNLAEDEFSEPTHAEFLGKAFTASGDSRFRVVRVPAIADWLRDFLRFRRSPFRRPGWRMRFPSERLHAAGYHLRFGMAHAHALALGVLREEAERNGNERASAPTNSGLAAPASEADRGRAVVESRGRAS